MCNKTAASSRKAKTIRTKGARISVKIGGHSAVKVVADSEAVLAMIKKEKFLR